MVDDGDIPKVKGFDSYPVRLGDLMRGERATMGKSLLDVQHDLRIRATYIAAIENCDCNAFSTPGFIAGYVRSYARYLGLDPDETFEQFCAESGFNGIHAEDRKIKGLQPRSDSGPSGSKVVQMRHETGPALKLPGNGFPEPAGAEGILAALPFSSISSIGSVLVLLALILGLGYGAWTVLLDIQRVEITPVQASPVIVADDSLKPKAPPSRANLGSAGLAATPVRSLRKLEVPVMTPRDGAIANLDPARIGALVPDNGGRQATEVARKLEASTPQVTEMAAPRLAVVARRPAWVRISRKDGTVLFERILDGGESFVLPEGVTDLRLRAGNSGNVYLTLDGRAYGPVGKGKSVAKNVVLSADVVASTFPKVSDNSALKALDKPRVITLNDKPASQ
ncbi:MAG: helix-turn-helix domain-containing protein [Paracoccaceae bacterium]|nr:helix-turn-helix domain-containing protein [Paracoccaceae bacterium]